MRTVVIGSCIVGGLITIGLVAHHFIKKDSNEPDKNSSEDEKKKDNYLPPEEKKIVKSPGTKPISDEFPLRLGSTGPRVERLKIYLLRNYGRKGKITDVFDENTQRDVMRFLKMKEVDQHLYKKLNMGKPVYE